MRHMAKRADNTMRTVPPSVLCEKSKSVKVVVSLLSPYCWRSAPIIII